MKRRCGVIAEKVGMSSIFSDDGRRVPVTLLKMAGCRVVAQKPGASESEVVLQVGFGERKRHAKSVRGYFAKAGVAPLKKLKEFRVPSEGAIPVGAEIKPSFFKAGDVVDVTGVSVGKGFAGVMKKYGFRGLRASHGVSVSHRSHGSTGQRKDPGRVFKNLKMAGHMGARRVTVQNLEVVSVDEALGVVLVKGSIPGVEGSTVILRDAVKRQRDCAISSEQFIEAGRE